MQGELFRGSMTGRTAAVHQYIFGSHRNVKRKTDFGDFEVFMKFMADGRSRFVLEQVVELDLLIVVAVRVMCCSGSG
jgi:hypothetical protein